MNSYFHKQFIKHYYFPINTGSSIDQHEKLSILELWNTDVCVLFQGKKKKDEKMKKWLHTGKRKKKKEI